MTVGNRFNRWAKRGVRLKVFGELARHSPHSLQLIDSSVVRAHQCGQIYETLDGSPPRQSKLQILALVEQGHVRLAWAGASDTFTKLVITRHRGMGYLLLALFLVVLGAVAYFARQVRAPAKSQLTYATAVKELQAETSDFEPGEWTTNHDDSVVVILEGNGRRLALVRVEASEVVSLVVRPDDILDVSGGSAAGKPKVEIRFIEHDEKPILIVFDSEAAAKSWLRKLKSLQDQV